MIDPRIEPATPFTEAEIAKIELIIGRMFPEDYRDFARAYGGAFVGGALDGDSDLPILTFLDPDALLSRLETHPDLRDEAILPVADCELGNLYVIDRKNAVHYINYYGGKTTSRKVADDFSDMLARIVVSDD